MAETIDRLRLALIDVLARAEASLTTPPARVYVSHGQPIRDCGQLTVHAESITAVQIASPSELGARVPVSVTQAALVVELVRCGVTGAAPAAVELDAQGKALATDAWEMWKGLQRAWASGQLFPSLPDVEPEAVSWRPGMTPIVDADVVGWSLGLTVRL